MLEFRYLPAFLAVAETGGFTAAGKRLRIATSAVSRQVQLLEEACGVQLFFRSTRDAALTPAGRRLYDELRGFQTKADLILRETAPPSLRLGTLQGVLRHWLVDRIAENAFFKTINLSISVLSPGAMIERVVGGDLDAAFFSYVHLTHVPSSLRVFRLFHEDIVLIATKRVTLDRIDDHPWICLTPDTWIVKHARKDPKRAIVVDHMDTVVELVRRGMGIAMVPSYVLPERHGLTVERVAKFAGQSICLVVRESERDTPALAEFMSIVKRNAPDWRQLQ